MNLLFVLLVVVVLVLAGQWYLWSRRRKVRTLFKILERQIGVPMSGNHMKLALPASRRVVLDAQVKSDDRPEELRLSAEAGWPGNFRLTSSEISSHYPDCRHRKPAQEGEPFSGWHAGSGDVALLRALSSDRRFREALENLAALGFTRIEFKKRWLRAAWAEFPWEPEKHDWDMSNLQALPNRLRRAAEKLSELVTATEAAVQGLGRRPAGEHVQTALTFLLVCPLVVMIAGIVAVILRVYDAYPTLRDSELLVTTIFASMAVTVPYTVMTYLLLRRSTQRGARSTLVGFVALFGFFPASSAAVLWWNGTGPQGPGERLTADVVGFDRHSALANGRGRLVRKLIGENSSLEPYLTTHRAFIRSWREPASKYAVTLTPEQFSALQERGGKLSLTVHPGALGIEWYTDVTIEVTTGRNDRPESKN